MLKKNKKCCIKKLQNIWGLLVLFVSVMPFFFSCSENIAVQGDLTVSKKEFYGYLERRGLKQRVLASKKKFLRYLGGYVTNKRFYTTAERQGVLHLFETNHSFLNIKRRIVINEINRSYKIPLSKLKNNLKKYSSSYKVKLFFIKGDTFIPFSKENIRTEFQKNVLEIRKAFKEGRSFEDIANRFALSAGARGRKRVAGNVLPDLFKERLDELENGRVSEPVLYKSNVYIFKRYDVRETDSGAHYLFQQILLTNRSVSDPYVKDVYQKTFEEDFDVLTMRYSEDPENFNGGSWPNLSYSRENAFLIDYLKDASPNDVFREIKIPGFYIYMKYLGKYNRTEQEIEDLKKDTPYLRTVQNNIIKMRHQGLTADIQYKYIDRKYENLYKDKEITLNTPVAVIRFPGRKKITMTISNVLAHVKHPPRNTDAFLKQNPAQLVDFLEKIIFKQARDMYYAGVDLRNPASRETVRQELRRYIVANSKDLAPEVYEVSVRSLKDNPVKWIYPNFPRKLFAEEIKTYKDRNKISSENLTNQAFESLKGFYSTQTAGSKKYRVAAEKSSTIIDEADAKLTEVWEASRDGFPLAEDVYRFYYENGNLMKAKSWFVRMSRSKGYTVSFLTNLYKESDFKKQWFILDAMGAFKPEKGHLTFLTNLLAGSTNTEHICFAIESLGAMKQPEVTNLLMKYYKHETWGVRLLAGKALEDITGGSFPVELPDE